MSREFQKLLETTILMRIDDLKANLGILQFIGLKFEETGMCSIDTLKILKEEAYKLNMINIDKINRE
jgi:hypothetical protein